MSVFINICIEPLYWIIGVEQALLDHVLEEVDPPVRYRASQSWPPALNTLHGIIQCYRQRTSASTY